MYGILSCAPSLFFLVFIKAEKSRKLFTRVSGMSVMSVMSVTLEDALNLVPVPIKRQRAESNIEITHVRDHEATALHDLDFGILFHRASDDGASDLTRDAYTRELQRRIEYLTTTSLRHSASIKSILDLYLSGDIPLLVCCRQVLRKCK